MFVKKTLVSFSIGLDENRKEVDWEKNSGSINNRN
jgi:hypothetical protein